MSKITLSNIANLADTTTAQTTINNNNAAITTAVTNALSRDGSSPNQMLSSLDMNLYQVLNLPAPATALSPLRLQDLTSFIGGGTVTNIPIGGTTGQVLAKTSNVDYAINWTNSVTSVGLTLPADFTVTNSPVTTAGVLTAAYVTPPTGTGALVRATSPTLITPVIGAATGTSLNLSGLTASSAVATDGSKNLVSVTNTGTGNNVLATSPTLTTPTLGVASVTSLTITGTAGAGFIEYPTEASAPSAPATGFRMYADSSGRKSWIRASDGFTRTWDAVLTGNRIYTFQDSSDTIVGRATTDILTNKTFDTAGAGNVFKINGVTITANTGTGSNVLSTSPTLVTPVLGVASATSMALANGTANGLQLIAASGTNGSLAMGVGGSLLFVLGSTLDTFAVNDHSGNTILSIVESTPGTLSSAQLTFSGTNQSTSSNTGSIQTLGGIGVAKDIVSGGSVYTSTATFMNRTKTTFTNNSAAAAGTLTNAPAAGNPTKWIGIDDNGTTRFIPAW